MRGIGHEARTTHDRRQKYSVGNLLPPIFDEVPILLEWRSGAEEYVRVAARVHGLEFSDEQVQAATKLRQEYLLEILKEQPLPPFAGVAQLIDAALGRGRRKGKGERRRESRGGRKKADSGRGLGIVEWNSSTIQYKSNGYL